MYSEDEQSEPDNHYFYYNEEVKSEHVVGSEESNFIFGSSRLVRQLRKLVKDFQVNN